jgi:hypothetical protein
VEFVAELEVLEGRVLARLLRLWLCLGSVIDCLCDNQLNALWLSHPGRVGGSIRDGVAELEARQADSTPGPKAGVGVSSADACTTQAKFREIVGSGESIYERWLAVE